MARIHGESLTEENEHPRTNGKSGNSAALPVSKVSGTDKMDRVAAGNRDATALADSAELGQKDSELVKSTFMQSVEKMRLRFDEAWKALAK